MATFPNSFWEWDEDEHGHTPPFLERRGAETLAPLPPPFEKEVAMTTLLHFSGGEAQGSWQLLQSAF